MKNRSMKNSRKILVSFLILLFVLQAASLFFKIEVLPARAEPDYEIISYDYWGGGGLWQKIGNIHPSTNSTWSAFGISLNASNNYYLSHVYFRIGIYIAGTSTYQVDLYAANGTWGVNNMPTGSLLATSEIVTQAQITANPYVWFNFTGVNQIQLIPGNKYCIYIKQVSGVGAINFMTQLSDPTGGNQISYYNSIWHTDPNNDIEYYLWGSSYPADAPVSFLENFEGDLSNWVDTGTQDPPSYVNITDAYSVSPSHSLLLNKSAEGSPDVSFYSLVYPEMANYTFTWRMKWSYPHGSSDYFGLWLSNSVELSPVVYAQMERDSTYLSVTGGGVGNDNETTQDYYIDDAWHFYQVNVQNSSDGALFRFCIDNYTFCELETPMLLYTLDSIEFFSDTLSYIYLDDIMLSDSPFPSVSYQVSNNWDQLLHDSNNSLVTHATAPTNNQTYWNYDNVTIGEYGGAYISHPIVHEDYVYYTIASYVYCLDKETGALIWSSYMGFETEGQCSVFGYYNGAVYVIGSRGLSFVARITSYNATTGSILADSGFNWTSTEYYYTSGWGSIPTVTMDIENGYVVLGSASKLIVLDAEDLSFLWYYSTGFTCAAVPVIVNGYCFLFGTYGNLIAVNMNTHSLIWSADPGSVYGSIYASASLVYNSGKLYLTSGIQTTFRSNAGSIYVYNATTGVLINSAKAVGYSTGLYQRFPGLAIVDEYIVEAGASGIMVLNESSLSKIWYNYIGTISGFAVAGDSFSGYKIYAATDSGLRCLDLLTGGSLWLNTESTDFMQPVVSENLVYVSENGGELWAIGGEADLEHSAITLDLYPYYLAPGGTEYINVTLTTLGDDLEPDGSGYISIYTAPVDEDGINVDYSETVLISQTSVDDVLPFLIQTNYTEGWAGLNFVWATFSGDGVYSGSFSGLEEYFIVDASTTANPDLYFRSDTYETLEISSYGLDADYTNNYQTLTNSYASDTPVQYGFRVYLSYNPVQEIELTSGSPEGSIIFMGTDSGAFGGSWSCPGHSVILGFTAMRVELYINTDLNDPSWTSLANFISPVLITKELEETTWTFILYVDYSNNGSYTSSTVYFGDTTYRSGISGVSFTVPLESEVELWRLTTGDYVGFALGAYVDIIGEAFYLLALFGLGSLLYFRYKHFGVIVFMFTIFGGTGGLIWFLVPVWAAIPVALFILIGVTALTWRLIR